MPSWLRKRLAESYRRFGLCDVYCYLFRMQILLQRSPQVEATRPLRRLQTLSDATLLTPWDSPCQLASRKLFTPLKAGQPPEFGQLSLAIAEAVGKVGGNLLSGKLDRENYLRIMNSVVTRSSMAT